MTSLGTITSLTRRVCSAGLLFVALSGPVDPAFAQPGTRAHDPGNESCVQGTFEVLDPASTTTIFPSEHFAVRWNAGDGVVLTGAEVQFGLAVLEDLWRVYMEDIGFPEPYCETAQKYKVNVNVSNQGWATGGGTGDHDPAMWVHYNAFKDAGALAHEFTHTLQFATRGLRDARYVGWMWESHAEWMRHQFPGFRDQVNCAELLVNYPHLYYGSTRDRYCNWQFWEFEKDRYGYEIINDIWRNAKEPEEEGYLQEDPFTIMARNRGWSASELNDEFGWWALHNATWDYTNPDGSDQGAVYRAAFGSYGSRTGNRALRVTQLDPIDLDQGRFVVSEYWAPQRWGYNLVRLYPDNPGQDITINVTFRGVVQDEPYSTKFGLYANVPRPIPDPDSDWRWGLVALGASGERRYSPLQRGPDAELAFEIKADDREIWMAVVGTPKTIHQVLWDQMYFTVYRYPWMAQFEGVKPDGYQAGAPNPSSLGHRHPNGGGWVSSTASVASTAYVGPYAVVLGGTVKDSARIEDHAIIQSGVVSGKAVVGGLTILTGGTQVTDQATVRTVFMGPGAFERNITLSGTARLIGDAEVRGEGLTLSNGIYYGFVDASTARNILFGYQIKTEPGGLTAPGPYAWRDAPVDVGQEPLLPAMYRLEQNYPNPFNPTTTIAYDVPAAGHVRLQVYDTLGRPVATLVDDEVAAGQHKVSFQAANLPSGVYFYRLETNRLQVTRSLTVVK